MEIIKSNKGLTLIEIIVSLTILSIIILSILNFFPQMGLMNKQNEEKTQAVNTAKQMLNEWQKDELVNQALKKANPQQIDWPTSFVALRGDYYFFKTEDPKAEIKIWKQVETGFSSTSPIKAHQIHIQLLNKRDNVISETYGYVIVK